MAYWNAPNKLKDHPDLSVQAAIKQIDTLQELNKTLQIEFGVSLKIGIGIHTGLAVVGEMGSKGRSDYTIIGDNVNLTSRIEGLTKYFGAKILISQSTKNMLKEAYNFKYVASVVVKGKTSSIDLYEVLNSTDYKTYELIKNDYEEAILNYKKRNFKLSLDLFYKVNQIQKHVLNDMYIEKIINIEKSQDTNESLDFHMDSK
jgi:adenylate cyclase